MESVSRYLRRGPASKFFFITFGRINLNMIRSGKKIGSIFLLLPILTILAHNSIPHHHHAGLIELCCGNEQRHGGAGHFLITPAHAQAGHHEACSFNPEFTIDLYKVLIMAVTADLNGMDCPLKWIESEYLVWYTGDAPSKIDPAPNLLRGPPEAA